MSLYPARYRSRFCTSRESAQRPKAKSHPHTAMSERWTCATGICQSICKAHVFDKTFRVNSAFNAEVFIATPPAVAMEFDLFGERRSGHWVKGARLAKLIGYIAGKKPLWPYDVPWMYHPHVSGAPESDHDQSNP